MCSNPDVLQITRIVSILIMAIRITVPIILIVILMIRIIKSIFDPSTTELSAMKRDVVRKVVTAVAVFLIPPFVSFLMNIISPQNEYRCFINTTNEDLKSAINNKAKELVDEAEKNTTISSYDAAESYLDKLDDGSLKDELSNKLAELKEELDKNGEQKEPEEPEEPSNIEIKHNYDNVNYDNFKWTAYTSTKGPANKYYSNVLPYAEWAPTNVSDLNGESLPLIIWLHGSGELAYNMSISQYVKTAFPKVVSNWKKSGLDEIPAIIIAPQSSGQWASENSSNTRNIDSIKALIEYAQEKYNIDPNNIVLMGHSLGSRGVTQVAYEMQKKYSKDYFNKLVLFSGGPGTIYPSKNSESAKAYFSSKDIRGYGEPATATGDFFDWINKPENYTKVSNASHGTVTEKGMQIDENKDGVSDLMSWLFDL